MKKKDLKKITKDQAIKDLNKFKKDLFNCGHIVDAASFYLGS